MPELSIAFFALIHSDRGMDSAMNNPGKIGIVTVTYNSGKVLDQFLQSLASQTHANFAVYAVDNASQDDSIARMQAWNDERLRVIRNAVNVGVAEADNQGIQAALADGCEFVLFLNNDVEFEPETLAVLTAE